MARHYSLDELAVLSGANRDQIARWDREGKLGTVPKNDAGSPVYGFEQAERAVALGGRATHRRISVVNQKGGVGKTTTVFTLAAAMADLGRRVLAVDLDAQANLTSSFGYDPDTLDLTSEDLLTDERVAPEDVILETAIEGVHLVPADIKLCRADVKIQEMFMRELILQSKLRHLFDHYHAILFDCPPNLSRVTINALLSSDEVVVPVETQSYSIKALSDLTSTFSLIRAKMNHVLRVWILPTKVDRTSALANEFLRALDQSFGERMLPGVSADSDIVKAPMIYEPVVRSFPDSASAKEYRKLAAFLLLPDAERDAAAKEPKRST
jgi:chromosome partitioning protein